MSDDAVTDYGWDGTEGPRSCGYIAPAVLKILTDLGVTRVLDLGSGNGALCARLDEHGLRPVGVEYDATGAELSRRAYPNIPFYRFGVQDDPARLIEQEGRFDAVVSTEVIEHLYSPHLLPRYAHACLRDGGHLVVTTPYHGYVKNLAIALLNKWDGHHDPLWHGGHIKFWSRRTLTELLEQEGFRVMGFSGVGRLPYLWKSMVIVARRV